MKYHKWMKQAGMLALAGCMAVSCISVPVYAEKTNEEAAEEFDKQFPYKEKQKLPGQLF